ncbi:MAG TPA: tetratricopeptide repeat protein [Steroidobacteraceae bacterium]|nr:tetratricopeptide repeat protein [Steroidobacteraceae bacterium]
MADAVNRLSHSAAHKGEKHYLLLVGPRGSGKTHFVALAYHRIRARFDLEQLQKKPRIAFLNEEEWGVASYLDFLVRILRALATESPVLLQKIEEIYAKFVSAPHNAEELAERVISDHVGEGTLVLICENLNDLFDGLGEEGQKRWRAFVQETGNWAILATTPRLFPAVTQQQNPFYGFFAIRELKGLSYETAHALLVKKALHDGQETLARFLVTPIGRARIRAVHHLAAGNHRAYVILYDFLDRQSLDDLVVPFMHMVDDLTPYYQDRMRQLPPAQRKIVEFLCQTPKPIAVKQVASSCLMSQQTAAKQLLELGHAGFIRRIPIGRQTFCELAEPLMRICIEVKDNRTEHFRLFVEFLRHWFSSREIEQRVTVLETTQHSHVLDTVHLKEALRCSRSDATEPFVAALRREGLLCLEKKDYRGLAAIQEKLVGEGGQAADYHWYVFALNELRDTGAATGVAAEAVEKYPDDHRLLFDFAEALFAEKKYGQAAHNLERAIALDPSEAIYHCMYVSMLLRLKRYEDAVGAARHSLTLHPTHWHSYDQMSEALIKLNRKQEAEREITSLLEREPNTVGAILCAAHYYLSQQDAERALPLAARAVELEPKNADARFARGGAHFDVGAFQAASEDFRFVISINPLSVGTHCRLSDTLIHLEDYTGAILAAEQLLKLDPMHVHGYVVIGHAMLALNRTEEAFAALGKLLAYKNVAALRDGADIASLYGNSELAMKLILKAEEAGPSNADVWDVQAAVFARRGEFDQAWQALETAMGLNSALPKSLRELLRREAAVAPLSGVVSRLRKAGITPERPEIRRSVVEGIAAAMTESVARYGPVYLGPWATDSRELYEPTALGEILTLFVINVVKNLRGSIEEWEFALTGLRDSLAGIKECVIPISLLAAAARFDKLQDRKALLQLPLEQRQLLQDVLPSLAEIDGIAATSRATAT